MKKEMPYPMDMYTPGQTIRTIRTGNTFHIQYPSEEIPKPCQCGGMGCVYIARREKDNKLYALKTLNQWNPENFESIKAAAFFFGESLVWITIGKHSNIVQAYWFDLDENYRPFLIIEYVSGHSLGVTSLRDWLEWRENVNFPPDMETAAGIRFVFEAVKGLAYAKKQVNKNLGIPFIHKDIKPENLLITREGILKVTDFGLVFGRGGTPRYMAPEQRINKEVEEKTDVYALGYILYEILSKQLFEKSVIAAETLDYSHFDEKFFFLDNFIPELRQLLTKCLAKNPDNRPDFISFMLELQHIYKGLFGEILFLEDELIPMDDEDFNARGCGFDQLGFHKKALACYNNAISLNPKDVRYYINRGSCFICLEETEGARLDYEKALSISQNVEIYLGLGALYIQKGEFEKAKNYYMKANEINPKDSRTYVGLGILCAKQEMYPKAEEYFRNALQFNSKAAEAYLGLANVFICKREYEKAEAEYRNSIRLNPLCPEAHQNLVQLYEFIGNYHAKEKEMEIVSILDFWKKEFEDGKYLE